MAFHLTRTDETFQLSAGHWTVCLFIAQAFGWKPAGTQPPADYTDTKNWHGQYDTNDGQVVTEEDAQFFVKVLHAAIVSEHIDVALADMIRHTEKQAEDAGMTIPEAMRMKNEDFYDEFSPLLEFLYKGSFVIA